MRHFKRLILLLTALAVGVACAGTTSRPSNPHQRHAKQDYRYKVPKLKYKAPKIKGHKPHHH